MMTSGLVVSSAARLCVSLVGRPGVAVRLLLLPASRHGGLAPSRLQSPACGSSSSPARSLATSAGLRWAERGGDAGGPGKSEERDAAAFKKYETAASTEPEHFTATIQKKVQSDDNMKEQHGGHHFRALEPVPPSPPPSPPALTEDRDQSYLQPHPIWSREEMDGVQITHRPPENMSDKAAYYTVMLLRRSFDFFSGYSISRRIGTIDERSVLIRCIFLETVAGVPGFVAAMVRHLHSLGRMQRDHGWIHTLLEEAENERMHLMTFLQLRRPGPLFSFMVMVTQGVFTTFFSLAYLVSPRYCHRFVGYLEEQAVITYTHILEELDSGKLPMWRQLPAPDIAKTYWKLGDRAMMRDVINAIRADEAHHRHVNHTLSSMKLREKNPFKPGE